MKITQIGFVFSMVVSMLACGKQPAPESPGPEVPASVDTEATTPTPAIDAAAAPDGVAASAGASCATMRCEEGHLCVTTDGAAECVEADVVADVSEKEGTYTIKLVGNDEFSVSATEYEELVAIDSTAVVTERVAEKKFGLPHIRLTPKKKCYCFKCGGEGNKIRTGCSRLGKEKAGLDASINCGINRNATYFHTGKC